ncbi:MAG: hypothetical protein FJ098_12215 [Deltaproteobacteria bacterium]|nr:hypothetical protein [Deltaproteobacteria bacterium]
MKRLLEGLRSAFRKPWVRYLVVLGVAGGALLMLHDAPCDVSFSVDLERVHRLDEAVLERLVVRVEDADGGWISTSTFEFPPSLYPDGPGPLRTSPSGIRLQLPRGTCLVTLTMSYRALGSRPPPKELVYREQVDISERDARLTLRP